MLKKHMTNILAKYIAFIDRFSVYNASFHCESVYYRWKYDTSFPKMMLLDEDGYLYDYSVFKDLKVNQNNYRTYLESSVPKHRISSLSIEEAERIMEDNMIAQERMGTLRQKAETIKNIMKNNRL